MILLNHEACGFRNKTTFLNAFKKYYGLTPSEYKNNKAGMITQESR
jgi:AraC-like DNA-binding protein